MAYWLKQVAVILIVGTIAQYIACRFAFLDVIGEIGESNLFRWCAIAASVATFGEVIAICSLAYCFQYCRARTVQCSAIVVTIGGVASSALSWIWLVALVGI